MAAMNLGIISRSALFALALAAACAPNIAYAAGAEDKFAQGTAAFTEGKLEEALKIFQEIWKTTKSYDVALMLAHTERNLSKFKDAAEHYGYALANFPVTGEAEEREEAAKLLADVKKNVGTVRIRVPVKDAVVKVNGVALDAALLGQDVYLNKGKSTIEAAAPGYQTATKTVEIKGGESQDLTITLVAEATAPRSKVPAFVVGGIGVVGIVVGAALIGAAEGKKGEAFKLHDELGSAAGCNADPVKCKALRDATAAADALGNGGVAAFVIGGLAGAAAAGYMLIPSRKPQTGKVAIVPVIAPGAGYLSLSGAF